MFAPARAGSGFDRLREGLVELDDLEVEEGERKAGEWMHLVAVGPGADELLDGSLRVDSLDRSVEPSRFHVLVPDNLVLAAPPDVERDAFGGELVDVEDRASGRERFRVRGGRAADLDAGEPLEGSLARCGR